MLENCTDVTVYTSPGLPTAFISNIEPSATDNLGILSVLCLVVSPNGVVRGIGTYTFNCIATDRSDAGLTDSCALTVIVAGE